MNRNKTYTVLTVTLFCIFLCSCPRLYAQIKIGANPSLLNNNAALEIESLNKGLLLPRLALNATDSTSPLNSFVAGMFIYNISSVNDVTPGIYYSDGSKWIKINPVTPMSIPAAVWSLSGNSGTASGNNFLGTNDNASLVLKTNNTERLRISANGWVGIGTSSPAAALQVKGQMIIDSLQAGNAATDYVLVANPANGKVKSVPSSGFVTGVQKRVEIVINPGQTLFLTPAIISDINKISLYRNGVLISFTVNNANSIIAEIPSVTGDEIRIIQLL